MPNFPDNVARSLVSASSAYKAMQNLYDVFNPENNVVMYVPMGDLIPDEWVAAATNGTSAAVSVGSGLLTCTTGTDDDGYAGQAYGLLWTGDRGYASEFVFAPGATITTIKFEVGMTDAVADAGAVATKATPTGTADDFVVLVYDTDDNTELDIIYELDNGGPAVSAENVATVAGSTYLKAGFRAYGDNVGVTINGVTYTASCQGGDPVTPWVFAQARAATASRTLGIRWIFCAGPSGIVIPG